MLKIRKEYLDKRICDIYGYGDNDETLREYIIDSEESFQIESKDIDKMSDKELQEYVALLDMHWNTYMNLVQTVDTEKIMREVLTDKE